MKQFEQVQTSIKENVAIARAGYGRGFWTLAFGIVLAVSLILQMEISRAKPVVERIPAAEVVNTKR